jgi:phosphatidylserine decarboxylase
VCFLCQLHTGSLEDGPACCLRGAWWWQTVAGRKACIGHSVAGLLSWSVLTSTRQLPQGDELGYFAFGGSTVIAMFAREKIVIDEDLVHNRSVCTCAC